MREGEETWIRMNPDYMDGEDHEDDVRAGYVLSRVSFEYGSPVPAVFDNELTFNDLVLL